MLIKTTYREFSHLVRSLAGRSKDAYRAHVTLLLTEDSHIQGCGLVSNSRSLPRSQFSTADAVCNSLPLRSAHSQTTATRHPISRRSRRFRPSLSTFSANLDCQKFVRVAGVVVYRQLTCLCQKQP